MGYRCSIPEGQNKDLRFPGVLRAEGRKRLALLTWGNSEQSSGMVTVERWCLFVQKAKVASSFRVEVGIF